VDVEKIHEDGDQNRVTSRIGILRLFNLQNLAVNDGKHKLLALGNFTRRVPEELNHKNKKRPEDDAQKAPAHCRREKRKNARARHEGPTLFRKDGMGIDSFIHRY
jgi:hypothetical protein